MKNVGQTKSINQTNQEVKMGELQLSTTNNVNGTSLKGEINCRFSTLVNAFGKPNDEYDDYKSDAAWRGKINGVVFTIYNWKNGKNYLGSQGKDVDDITCWHIGGYNNDAVAAVKAYILQETNKEV